MSVHQFRIGSDTSGYRAEVRDMLIESINALSSTSRAPIAFSDETVVGDVGFATAVMREFVRRIGGNGEEQIFVVSCTDSSEVTFGTLFNLCAIEKQKKNVC